MNNTSPVQFTKKNPNIKILQDKLNGKVTWPGLSVGSSDKLYHGKYPYSLRVTSRHLDSYYLRSNKRNKFWRARDELSKSTYHMENYLRFIRDYRGEDNRMPYKEGDCQVTYQHIWQGVVFYTTDLDMLVDIAIAVCTNIFPQSEADDYSYYLDFAVCWPGQTARQRFCKELPHKTYKYRITFKSNAVFHIEEKRQFVEWIDTYGDEFKMTTAMRHFFEISNWNFNHSTKYFYAKNDTLLSLITLYHSDKILNIDEYVTAENLSNQPSKEIEIA
jgi:hypothetical protein